MVGTVDRHDNVSDNTVERYQLFVFETETETHYQRLVRSHDIDRSPQTWLKAKLFLYLRA